MPFIVGWALEGLPEEARDAMFARPAAPYRVLHALVRRRFERAEARAFRYGDGVSLSIRNVSPTGSDRSSAGP